MIYDINGEPVKCHDCGEMADSCYCLTPCEFCADPACPGGCEESDEADAFSS
jgi:hypothetical protein